RAPGKGDSGRLGNVAELQPRLRKQLLKDPLDRGFIEGGQTCQGLHQSGEERYALSRKKLRRGFTVVYDMVGEVEPQPLRHLDQGLAAFAHRVYRSGKI